jgi:hypothetical protein
MDEVAAADSRRALAAFAVYRSTNVGAWIEVTGWSMSPLIRPGDELYVEFGDRRPRRGEIAVFREGELMIAHRVVGGERFGSKELLITRGDGMGAFDPPFPADEVLGVVRACRRPERTSNVPIAARGLPATGAGLVSAGAGHLLVEVDRLPTALRRPAGAVARRLVPAAVNRLLRAAAWSERFLVPSRIDC